MKHNTIKHQEEFIKWLKENRMYNEMAPAHEMRFGHEVYWTMKEGKK